MKNVIDRQPTLPRRMLITPDIGDPFYATVEYADEPLETGTPLNRALFLEMQGFIGTNIVYDIDGNITETNDDGDTLETVFNIDDTITETFTSGTVVLVRTTVFNIDGSITITIS